jgi:hypothetical protein
MRAAGILTVQSPADIGRTLAAALGKLKKKSNLMVMPKPKKTSPMKPKFKPKGKKR